MIIKQADLIDRFERDARYILEKVKPLQNLPSETLRKHPKENSWNALEIIEHLNLYSDFYLPEISKAVECAGKSPKASEGNFKSGFLGNYFAQSMLPTETGKIKNPMKTFKSKDTRGQKLDEATIAKFCKQHEELLGLIAASREIDLNRAKTSISISRLIRLKLGDTLRFYIGHELRHLTQLDNCLRLVAAQDSTSSI